LVLPVVPHAFGVAESTIDLIHLTDQSKCMLEDRPAVTIVAHGFLRVVGLEDLELIRQRENHCR